LLHLRGGPVPGFARRETLDVLRSRFDYVFEGSVAGVPGGPGYPAVVDGGLLPDRLAVGPISVRVVDQPHGRITSAGLRFDAGDHSIAYSTDCNELTEEMKTLFQGVDVWVVDALRHRPHPTHPHLALTLQWVDAVRPRRAILTHMDNSMDYAALVADLPPGVEPGYDGLEVRL
jgi:phosphoribosyl 1,2-cyclic phosphate phosphodiesterase